MKRNKKFYESKRLRKLSKDFNEAFHKAPKVHSSYLQGYMITITTTERARNLLIYNDFRKAVQLVSKTDWIKSKDDFKFYCDSHKTTELLKTISIKEYNGLTERLKYFFRPYYSWIFDGCNGVALDRVHTGYSLKQRFVPYLGFNLSKMMKSITINRPSSEFHEIKNKIERNNLWPKIDKSLGLSHNRYGWKVIKRQKVEKVLKKEFQEEVRDV